MFWLTLLLAGSFTPRTAIDYRQPQLAASGQLAAATFATSSTIFSAVSRDAGQTWTPAGKVDEPGVLSLGNHRGPRVVISRGVLIVSAVAGKVGKGVDGDLLTWRSTDTGKTWTRGPAVTDRAGAAREGLHAMASAGDGRLFATWLDLRNAQPGRPGTELWGAYSQDQGATWSKNFLVYRSPSGSICQCCHPSVLFDSKGTLHVMWRNELRGDRDLYTMQSKDGGRTFNEAARLGVVSWKLAACPMDGGGIAESPDGRAITVWRRANQIYLASEGGPETLLGEGKNPAVAEGKEGLYVAWRSSEGVVARVPGHAEPVLLDEGGTFVTLAAVPNGPVIAAWERKGTIQFHTLP